MFRTITSIKLQGIHIYIIDINVSGNQGVKVRWRGLNLEIWKFYFKILWTKETVLMLNPKKSMFSEMVKIPYTEIENASRLVFNMKFPESENEENEHGDPATQVVYGDIFKNGKKF